jgi:MFS transporter, FHS family, glucose/mannose:H+ symporter
VTRAADTQSNPSTRVHGRSLRAGLLLMLGFIVTGMVTTVLGPVLPWLAARWALSDPAAGALFTLQFVCGLIGGSASGQLVERIGDTRTLAAGFAVMSAGTLVLAIGDYLSGVAGICAAGIGMGFVIPTTNLLVAKLHPERAASALSAVNLAWGAGAAIWPLIVAAATRVRGWSWALAGLAVLNLVVGSIVIRVPALGTAPRDPAQDKPLDSTRDRPLDPERNRPVDSTLGRPASGILHTREARAAHVALFGVLLFLYTGIETAFGGWLPEQARRSMANALPMQWTLAATSFWSGLTGGRALFAFSLQRRLEDRVAIAGLVVAACSLVLLLRARSVISVTAAAFAGGLGLAPVFPVTVAALSRRVRAGVGGPMIALGSLGGATVPWVVGAVSGYSGSLTSGLATLLAITALLIALHVVRVSVQRSSDASYG